MPIELPSDPMERIIAAALQDAGISYVREAYNEARLDFYLPDFDTHIEVKQFHSERIGEQMERANNVIAVQGRTAVNFLAELIRGLPRSDTA